MTQAAPLEDPRSGGRWLLRRMPGVLSILFLLGVLLAVGLPSGGCACEHDPAHGAPSPGQTVAPEVAADAGIAPATPVTFAYRSYENTCDGAQAYVHDTWEVMEDIIKPDMSWSDRMELPLAYFRNSTPPPIMEEWRDAQVAFYAAMSDFDVSMDTTALLDAFDDAEENLEDQCPSLEIYTG